MRPSSDVYFLQLAKLVATRTTCLRRAVGCVLVDERNHILATGYNGVPAGLPHCNEMVKTPVYHDDPRVWYDQGSGEFVFEGKRSACLKLGDPRSLQCVGFEETYPHACEGAKAPSGTCLDGCQAVHAEQNALLQCHDVHQIKTAYCTTSPCLTCVKLLLNTSCQRVVFIEEYPHVKAEALWEGAGRVWQKIEV